VLPANNVLEHMAEEFHGPGEFIVSALSAPPVWLAAAGVLDRLYLLQVETRAGRLSGALLQVAPQDSKRRSTASTGSMKNVIAAAARGLGGGLWRFGDQDLIDDGLVNGSARVVGWFSSVMRYAQSGYLYHYAFAMILGLASLLLWLIWRPMMLNDPLARGLDLGGPLPAASLSLDWAIVLRPRGWVSLGVFDRHVRVQHPLVGMVQDRHRGDAIRLKLGHGFRPFTRTSISASTGFRCL